MYKIITGALCASIVAGCENLFDKKGYLERGEDWCEEWAAQGDCVSKYDAWWMEENCAMSCGCTLECPCFMIQDIRPEEDD